MQRMSIKRIFAIVASILFACIITFILVKDYEVSSPSNWNQNIKLRANAFLGRNRVVDADSGATLFYYSNDPEVQPVSIEKKDNNTWIVVFEKKR